LIVEPTRAVRALEIFRQGGEHSFRDAEVINTTKTENTRPAEKGSLAQIISTDNPHARAFLNYRIGRLMMVETMDRMAAAENAITPDLMVQGGRTVRRLQKPQYLKLGRATQEQMRQQLQAERQQLLQQLAGSAGDVRRAEDEARLFEATFAQFQAIRDSGLTCFGCGEELAAFDRRLAEIGKNIEDAKRNRDPKLVADLERLAVEVKAARRPAIRTLRGWAISVLQEAGAIHECEEHGWAQDRADPHARERAFDLARRDPPSGISPEAAAAEVRGVLNSIGDTRPECTLPS